MERCPFCKARLSENRCSRCQADLASTFAAEKAAQFWLTKALQEYAADRKAPGLQALEMSLLLKKNTLALAFRDFLIERESRHIIDLLAEKQLFAAKQHIDALRLLLPHSQLLQELNSFTDHFLLKHIS